MSTAHRGRDSAGGAAADSESGYGEVVDRIRALTVERHFAPPVSDDTDAWMEGSYDYSPNNEALAAAVSGVEEADRLVRQLIGAGAAAVPAVAKGLLMQGRWRLHLFPFVVAFREDPEIAAALTRVVARRNDPCRKRAWVVLSSS